MEDGNGRRIDFKNTLIILTTNVGTDMIMGLSRDPKYRDDPEELGLRLRPELLEVFPAALLGRIVTIPYFPLTMPCLMESSGYSLVVSINAFATTMARHSSTLTR